MNLLIVVDCHNHIHSDFHTVGRGADDLTVDRIMEMLVQIRPTHIAAAFDSPTSFRRALWPKYKADREEKPDELIWALAQCWRRLSAKGIHCHMRDLHEADDIVATFARQFNGKVIISSTDTDLHQCLEAGRVNMLKKFRVEETGQPRAPHYYTSSDLVSEFGFGPERWIEYTSLVGKAGQWDGCEGVGAVRARELMAMGPLDQLLEQIGKIEHKLITVVRRTALKEFKERLPLVRQLATLKTDLDIDTTRSVNPFLKD